MTAVDWVIVATLTAAPIVYGMLFTRTASKSGEEGYFTANRNLTWWQIGISSTATYHGGMAPFLGLTFALGLAFSWLW